MIAAYVGSNPTRAAPLNGIVKTNIIERKKRTWKTEKKMRTKRLRN